MISILFILFHLSILLFITKELLKIVALSRVWTGNYSDEWNRNRRVSV